jgi:large-conductance mechanosensitive channel
MENWRIVGKIASGFGIIFILFSIITAFVNYEAITLQSSFPPTGMLLQVYILNAMLPFLLFAVLSFIVAAVTLRITKDPEEAPPQPEQTEPQPEEEAA